MSLGPAASVGRIVHVNLGRDTRPGHATDEREHVRPAIVVRTWGDTPESAINVQVLADGSNDVGLEYLVTNKRDPEAGPVWLTSILQGEGVGQWRWPPRV